MNLCGLLFVIQPLAYASQLLAKMHFSKFNLRFFCVKLHQKIIYNYFSEMQNPLRFAPLLQKLKFSLESFPFRHPNCLRNEFSSFA